MKERWHFTWPEQVILSINIYPQRVLNGDIYLMKKSLKIAFAMTISSNGYFKSEIKFAAKLWGKQMKNMGNPRIHKGGVYIKYILNQNLYSIQVSQFFKVYELITSKN